jgi:IS5 family transposase
MEKQQSFADMEYSNRKRKTKRDEFLEIMDEVIPWEDFVSLIRPHYPKGERGRPPREIEQMFRMYLLTQWFSLSDEGVEDAIYDSYAFRKFMRVDFMDGEQVPDATTLCKFRKLIHESGMAKQFFDSMKAFLDKHGKLMHGGTIVDATLIDAPTSTKNADKQRDPEMHQVKKGNEWYFGARLHAGVDAGTGYIHSVELTAANVSERSIVPQLIREDDEVLYGDAGYTGLEKRPEIMADPRLSKIDFRVNNRNPQRMKHKSKVPGFDWDQYIEYQKSRVRCKVEYVFLVIKRIFGYRKVRYRGMAKNRTHAYMLCTCANLFLLGQSMKKRVC